MALCLPCFTLAQGAKAASITPPRTLFIKRGSSALQRLEITVRPGFHINSDKPLDEFTLALKLTWNKGPLDVKRVTFPKAETIKVGGEALSVYTGSFAIETEFQAPAQAMPGIALMTGKLRYQACNDQMCLRPVTVDVQAPVSIH